MLNRLNIILTDGAVQATAAVAGIATELVADTTSTAHIPTTLLTHSHTAAKKPAEGGEIRLALKFLKLLKSNQNSNVVFINAFPPVIYFSIKRQSSLAGLAEKINRLYRARIIKTRFTTKISY